MWIVFVGMGIPNDGHLYWYFICVDVYFYLFSMASIEVPMFTGLSSAVEVIWIEIIFITESFYSIVLLTN